MSDALEKKLATDPDFAEKLEVIAEHPRYKPTPKRPARYDIARVRFGNVAKGRWLWVIEFGEPYTFDNASTILYVDTDNDKATGRPRMGCEVMYAQNRGRPWITGYSANGERSSSYPAHRVGLENGVLHICADIEINQEGSRSKFRMWMLSEQAQPHEGRDSLRAVAVEGPGDSDRPKVVTLADQTENENFEVTEGMKLLWRIHADKGNVILNAFKDCAHEGFAYNHSEYRWPSVRKRRGKGKLTVRVPKAGRFHLAAVVYDSSGEVKYEMSLNGKPIGRFVADADNRRQRLFFTPDPIDLKGGETIVLRAADTDGWYIVEDIMLLPQKPPVLRGAREIRNLEVRYERSRGRMRATWITTWPTICTLHCNGKTVREDAAVQNHRVYLPALQNGKRYACFVETDISGGEGLRSERVSFAAAEPETPRGTAARERIDLSLLTQGRDCPAGFPLTTGIPFPKGALGSSDNLRLLGSAGSEMPLQAKALMHWPDGSVKVALIDTMASKQPGPLTLEYGRDVRRKRPKELIQIREDKETITVTAPTIKAQFHPRESGLFTRVWSDPAGTFGHNTMITRDNAPVKITIVDDARNKYDTVGRPDRVVVEEAGPLRAVVMLEGRHTRAGGQFFTYQIRVTFHAGLPGMRVAYRWGNDVSKSEFIKFQRIQFELPLSMDKSADVVLGADKPVRGKFVSGARLGQPRDDGYSAKSVYGASEGKRAPGWAHVFRPGQSVALLSRWFWQLYPKAVSVSDRALRLDICPELGDKQYNDCSEIDLMKLYFYLQDGRYKVRQGVTKIHEMLLLLSAEPKTPKDLNAMTDLFNEPPVLAARPEWYAASGAFGKFVPQTAGRTPLYDDVCERTHRSYVRRRDGTRAFGMLNYGDVWGERRVNWSNGEYDHHHAAAQVFLRSADPRWFHLMEAMARHDIDVDLCHYHTNPRYRGASWVHAMGHTGSYFKKKYKGEWGTPRGGMTVSHTWCEGTCEYYALTGDPTAIEAARMIADHYGGAYVNNYDFTNGRVPGWHLLLTMAVYRATYDPFYLNAARIIVDRTLERRTPGSGWARQMVPGHCHCTPRCRGACSFMQGILGCGLREYYMETGDERIPEAVVAGARYAIDQMWVEEQTAFRYTSCPKSSVTASRNDTLAGLLLFAYELSGDPLFSGVVERGMNEGFRRLSSVSHLRWTPYIVHALDRIERAQLGIGGGRAAAMRLKCDRGRPFEVRLFDRTGKGAPSDAAELIAPSGKRVRPGAGGRMKIEDAARGIYRLRLARSSGPWQVTTTLRSAVVSLADGVDLDVGGEVARLCLRPVGRQRVRLTLDVAQGLLQASLHSPSGRQVAEAKDGARLTLVSKSAATGLYELRLRGPAKFRLTADGATPWGALAEWRYFNASVPTVTIQGDAILPPGRGRTVNLTAKAEDPEDDVVSIRWELPGGKTAKGRKLTYRATDSSRFEIRAIATDRQGNAGAATVEIRVPPVELADAEKAIFVQAEDFAAQGGGKVSIYKRIGCVGKMLTMWHMSIGHWLEWKFRVATEGDYVIYARYASGGQNPRRSLTLDGRVPHAAYKAIALKPTGGYCTSRDNWALQKLGPPVRLKPGEHRLRMANLGDGLALDYLAVAKVD